MKRPSLPRRPRIIALAARCTSGAYVEIKLQTPSTRRLPFAANSLVDFDTERRQRVPTRSPPTVSTSAARPTPSTRFAATAFAVD